MIDIAGVMKVIDGEVWVKGNVFAKEANIHAEKLAAISKLAKEVRTTDSRSHILLHMIATIAEVPDEIKKIAGIK